MKPLAPFAKGRVNYCGHRYEAEVEFLFAHHVVVRFHLASGAEQVKRIRLITSGALAAGRSGFAPTSDPS